MVDHMECYNFLSFSRKINRICVHLVATLIGRSVCNFFSLWGRTESIGTWITMRCAEVMGTVALCGINEALTNSFLVLIDSWFARWVGDSRKIWWPHDVEHTFCSSAFSISNRYALFLQHKEIIGKVNLI